PISVDMRMAPKRGRSRCGFVELFEKRAPARLGSFRTRQWQWRVHAGAHLAMPLNQLILKALYGRQPLFHLDAALCPLQLMAYLFPDAHQFDAFAREMRTLARDLQLCLAGGGFCFFQFPFQ